MQVFDDPTELMVEFKTINLWIVGDENTVEYILPTGFEELEADWIGIYKVRVICCSVIVLLIVS